MDSLVLLLLVTLGALISALTGLGGGTLILAGLLLVFPPEVALPLHSFTQLSSNALRTGLFFKEVHWKVVVSYAALMIPGAWLGAELFHQIDSNWLKILVGSFILISILPLPFKPTNVPSMKTFITLGGISGFLGVFVGAVGPMVTPFFNRLKLSRQGMLSTKSAGQSMLQVSKILAFWGAADINFMALKANVLVLILGTLIGVGISIPISKKISDAKFDLMVNILLGLIALKVLYEGIRNLLHV